MHEPLVDRPDITRKYHEEILPWIDEASEYGTDRDSWRTGLEILYRNAIAMHKPFTEERFSARRSAYPCVGVEITPEHLQEMKNDDPGNPFIDHLETCMRMKKRLSDV